jgi:GNAT superfamily N-acetyltransferase
MDFAGFFMIEHIPSVAPVATVFAWHGSSASVGKLHWLAVDPAHQRQGLARFLVSSILRFFFSQGFVQVELSTEDFRKEAIQLYSTFGFHQVD